MKMYNTNQVIQTRLSCEYLYGMLSQSAGQNTTSVTRLSEVAGMIVLRTISHTTSRVMKRLHGKDIRTITNPDSSMD
jgi:hypothetical protein